MIQLVRCSVVVFVLTSLPSCATNRYVVLDLRSGNAAPELQQLARAAEAGDQQAQLALGIRFEEGRGVPRDLVRAEQLYAIAASSSAVIAYSPPIGRDSCGSVQRLEGGEGGLPEAKRRLKALRAARTGQHLPGDKG